LRIGSLKCAGPDDADACSAALSCSMYQPAGGALPGEVNCFTRASFSTVRAREPSPLIMNTKPERFAGNSVSAEYMPPNVPVCETRSTPSTSESLQP
jgi:hypothetical protein